MVAYLFRHPSSWKHKSGVRIIMLSRETNLFEIQVLLILAHLVGLRTPFHCQSVNSQVQDQVCHHHASFGCTPKQFVPTWCGLMCMAGVCRCGLVAHKSKMPDDARWVMIVQVETPSNWLLWGWYPHLPIGRMSRANGAGQFPPMFSDGANTFSFLIGKTAWPKGEVFTLHNLDGISNHNSWTNQKNAWTFLAHGGNNDFPVAISLRIISSRMAMVYWF